MVTTALKAPEEIYVFPPNFFPKSLRWQNFPEGWNYPNMNFPRWLLNSFVISGVTLVAVLLSSSWVAYGFARISFPGRNFWFIVMLASIMLPAQVTLIPIYIVFHKIGWLDTFKPLLIPPWFGGGAFNIFLLRQFFMSIPQDLEDAAHIDGASRWRIWAQLILPLSKPALATIAVFTFQGTWNDFYGPLIYLTSQEKFTLALGINMFKGMYYTQIHLMMAMAMLMVVPMIVVFFMAQKLMIQGVVLSGLKG
jgi:multiple sugar transport system permease protein